MAAKHRPIYAEHKRRLGSDQQIPVKQVIADLKTTLMKGNSKILVRLGKPGRRSHGAILYHQTAIAVHGTFIQVAKEQYSNPGRFRVFYPAGHGRLRALGTAGQQTQANQTGPQPFLSVCRRPGYSCTPLVSPQSDLLGTGQFDFNQAFED